MHECKSHNEWLVNVHYMCSCGHVEWAHHGTRLNKTSCAHCNCTRYNGETRPLTEFELLDLAKPEQKLSVEEFIKTWTEENK